MSEIKKFIIKGTIEWSVSGKTKEEAYVNFLEDYLPTLSAENDYYNLDWKVDREATEQDLIDFDQVDDEEEK